METVAKGGPSTDCGPTLSVTDADPVARAEEILTAQALAFLPQLHRRFAERRDQLVADRTAR